ncbi:MAG TPA: MFS transporter [Longimicrobiales bacterium]|nr:MFS transporter [Longimicrobiales bacterium]
MTERTQHGGAGALLHRLVDIRPGEVRAALLSGAYFFFVLTSYYILRPIRDEMGAAGGVENLPWLFTGTLAGMLLAQPLFAGLVARLPRRRFIPLTYRFFMLNLLLFFLALRAMPESQHVWVGRVFFIWASVFNLFVVSVFWGFMADLFRREQGKRLFGFIGLGGTTGAITGAGLTAFFVERVGSINMLIVSLVFLELAVWCVLALGREAREPRAEPEPGAESQDSDRVIGGSIWAGVTHVMRSPYLLGICLYMLLFTVGSTFLYIAQADIINQHFTDRDQRTAFFASLDLAVNVLTLLTQAFLTGRILKWLGVAVTLALLPTLSVLGFFALGAAPTLGIFVAFQVLRRAGNYAVARPTREVLFTVVPREEKYKAKSFIDTFVYRVGDQVGAWSYAGLLAFGLSLSAISFTAVPISAAWLGISLWLGRRNAVMRDARETPAPAHTPAPANT